MTILHFNGLVDSS